MSRISKAILLSVIPLIILAGSQAMAPSGNTNSLNDLTSLVPESALVTLEVKNLQKRWSELQAIPGMRRFHEKLLATVGMHPDDIPILAGESAVVALLPAENGHAIMPLVLIRPADMDAAESLLPEALTVHRSDNALWISFGDTADQLRELAEAGGPNLSWKPEGNELIHGTIDPEALAAFLRSGPEGFDPPPLAMARSIYAGMLDHVRSVEFTRDIVSGAVIADGRVELIPDRLPAEVLQVFRTPPDTPPLLPSPLPRHVIMASSFRTEPAASMAWLKQIADSDPRGPLRNFEFWMKEFEERTGRNLETDLVDSLGERGWCFLLEGDLSRTLNAVSIFETRNENLLDETFSDLFVWLGAQARGKSLGLVSPRIDGHSMTFRTPFGELPGPAFEIHDGHLLIGTSSEALDAGRKLLRTRSAWQPTVPAMPRTGQFANEAVRIAGPALSRWLEMPELPDELDSIALDVWYEGDAIQISAQARFQ